VGNFACKPMELEAGSLGPTWNKENLAEFRQLAESCGLTAAISGKIKY
jgi:hypothetical protein